MLKIARGEKSMKLKGFYLLLGIALILAGCGGGARLAQSPPVPAMEMSDNVGGTFDEESVVRRMDIGVDQTTNIADGTPAGVVQRMVVKTAELSIVVGDPLQKMDDVSNMAEEMGGFVVSSNVWQNTLSNGAKVPHASITIRVPSERLDEALGLIKAGVGEITSEKVSGQDVTSDYTDLQSRLRNLEAAETQLQEIMDEATKTEDVLQVYNNLVNVREQIEVIKGQMQYYEQAAALSMISVDITGDEEAQPLQIGGWQPAGVAKDAIETMINTLQSLGNIAIWFVLCVLPIGILVGVPLFFAGRYVRRLRKRKKAEVTAAKVDEESQISGLNS
jgi:hypothetical protein